MDKGQQVNLKTALIPITLSGLNIKIFKKLFDNFINFSP